MGILKLRILYDSEMLVSHELQRSVQSFRVFVQRDIGSHFYGYRNDIEDRWHIDRSIRVHCRHIEPTHKPSNQIGVSHAPPLGP